MKSRVRESAPPAAQHHGLRGRGFDADAGSDQDIAASPNPSSLGVGEPWDPGGTFRHGLPKYLSLGQQLTDNCRTGVLAVKNSCQHPPPPGNVSCVPTEMGGGAGGQADPLCDSGGEQSARAVPVLIQPASPLTRSRCMDFDATGRSPPPPWLRCGPPDVGRPCHQDFAASSARFTFLEGQPGLMPCATGRAVAWGEEPRHRKDRGRRRRRHYPNMI